MKSLLKITGLLLLLCVVVILIGGLLVSNDFKYEKSISINQPKEVIWIHVSTFSEMNKWSPWMKLDPEMRSAITGTDGTVGAIQSWAGNKDVGSGSQEIILIEPPNQLVTRLVFHEPYESEANSYIKLQPVGLSTTVTWGLEAEIPYPFNFIMLFMNNTSAMETDFGEGLSSLKTICES